MLEELERPSLEARRDWSSLLLFHKIHSGAVSIEKDKYLTPARSLNLPGHHTVPNIVAVIDMAILDFTKAFDKVSH